MRLLHFRMGYSTQKKVNIKNKLKFFARNFEPLLRLFGSGLNLMPSNQGTLPEGDGSIQLNPSFEVPCFTTK
jgi:hypothetical protein